MALLPSLTALLGISVKQVRLKATPQVPQKEVESVQLATTVLWAATHQLLVLLALTIPQLALLHPLLV